MAIEIHVPTGTRTLGGTTRAVVETLLAKGFQNIDPPESGKLEVELMNADGKEWAKTVPEEASAEELFRIWEALKQRYPVEEVINRIEEAWQLAKSQKSSRSMIAIIELIAERQFGKPVQTTQSPHGISDALALILSDTTPLLPIEGDEHNSMGSMGS